MTHQQINDLTEHNVDVERLEKLKRKQTPKTKAQRLKGFFWILVSVGFICQFLSALLASSGVLYYLSQKLNSAGIIVGFNDGYFYVFYETNDHCNVQAHRI